jgi:ubiquinone/menaquinone biosynthesis C-methylase UbiE
MVNDAGNTSNASLVRQSWIKNDGIMDEKLKPVSDILFESIGIPEGRKFLDIGCGAGSTTIRLGGLIRSGASVTGIDISEPMVSFAQEKANAIDNVDFVLGNAQTYEFGPDKFDGVLSRMGVMFFADPIQAFSNIHSALNKGAFLTFACWAPVEEGELTDLLLRTALKHTGKSHNDSGTAVGPDAFNDKEYVKSILSSSGFSNLSIATLKIHSRARISPEEDASVNMEIGCAQRIMVDAEADDVTRGKIYEELLTISKEHQDGDYVGYDRSIHVVSAIA